MRWDNKRTFHAVIILAAVVVSVLGFYKNQTFYDDDAYIGLRYAQNFTSGYGLVWNEGERVEGYTNFLYTLLEAMLGLAGIDLVVASRAINIFAFFILALFVLIRAPAAAMECNAKRELALIPFVIVLASFPLIIWTLGGLEGPFFTMLSVSGIWLFQEALGKHSADKRIVMSAILFGLACATRIDGILFVATSILFLLFESKDSRTKRLWIFAGVFLVFFLPSFLWRFTYYGSALPNSFWVKATGFSLGRLLSGVRYIFSYSITPPFLPVLASIVLSYSILRRSFDRKILYIAASIACYSSYIVYVGGDYMYAFRLILPMIPLVGLLMVVALTSTKQQLSRSVARAILLCLVMLAGLQLFPPSLNPRYRSAAAFIGTIVGKHIAATWPPGSLVALNTAGSTPFYAKDLRFVDMLGLNDAHIARRKIDKAELEWQSKAAHLKGDGAYVLSRQPDYIIIGPAEGTAIQTPWFLSDLEMSLNSQFYTDYELRLEHLVVADIAGYEHHRATRKGVLIFTYYKRKGHS